MLVVIVIIGVLAAALIPRITSIQARARDAQRKIDFRQIHSAILMYKIDNNSYPTVNGSIGNVYAFSTNGQIPWINTLS